MLQTGIPTEGGTPQQPALDEATSWLLAGCAAQPMLSDASAALPR